MTGKGDRDGDDLLDANMFCPLTEAKGELVDAYAMKPLYYEDELSKPDTQKEIHVHSQASE